MPKSPGIPPPDTSYSIDGGTPVIFQESQDGSMHFNQQFYKSATLSPGEHTLVITYLHNVAAYLLDYIFVVYETPAPSPSTTSTPTITPTTAKDPTLTTRIATTIMNGNSVHVTSTNGTVVTMTITSAALLSGTPTASATLSANPISVSNTVTANQNKTSTILGTALGVLGGIMVLLCILYIYRRVRRRRKMGSVCECNTFIMNVRCNADHLILFSRASYG